MCKEMYRDALIFPTPSGRPRTLMVTSTLSLETIVLDHPGSRFNAKHGTKSDSGYKEIALNLCIGRAGQMIT